MRQISRRDLDELASYEGTPFLSALANIAAAVGVFIGAYAAIILAGYAHRGFGYCWPEVLILVLDGAINAALQLLRFRRRRALGLTRAARRARVGLGPVSPAFRQPPSSRRR